MNDLELLQSIRMKGRATDATLALVLGSAEGDVADAVARLVGRGLVEPTAHGTRLTPQGREQLDDELARERAGVDAAALAAAYDTFCGINDEVKRVVTAWQLVDEQTVNDHSDAAYDATVVAQLRDVHGRVVPLLDELAARAPRLARYGRRLGAAVEAIGAGDHRFVASPVVDSYHTVWFELHEELIGLLGRTRADEAAAGRAV